MSFKLARIAGVCAGLAAAATPASAQDSMQQELARLRQQMQQMMSAYERQISALETRLKAVEQKAAEAPTPATPPAPQAALPAPSQTAAAPSALQRAITPTPPPPAASVAAPGGLGRPAASGSAFNPEIGVVLDGRYSAFSKDPGTFIIPGFMLGGEAGPGPRGFALGESELNFSANVDQHLYAAATIAFEREGEVSVEEAFVQSTSLPWGFTAKGGRFFGGFGYLNSKHRHVWDFADVPLPYQAFLGGQFGDDGVEVRWVAPIDLFLEVGGAVSRGDAFPAGGAANRGVGAWNVFAHLGDDINDSSSYRLGAALLQARAHDRSSDGDANLFTGVSNTGIFDAVYTWAPNGNPVETNLKLQAEYFLRQERGMFNATDFINHEQGFYAQAVYQFMPRWRAGVRYDRVWAQPIEPTFAGTTLDNFSHIPKRYAAMLDYSTSEFGRFRLQYNRDESRLDNDIDHQVILQYTVSFGAHPAHAY